MGEQSQIRSRSWNRMPTKRCSVNSIMNEFIVVDDDEVIILDLPESPRGKTSGTSRTRNKRIFQRVISLDDDDDDDDVDDTENVHRVRSTSRISCPAYFQTSAGVDNDDCQFIHEKYTAFRFSKCKQSFSAMPSSGIKFGLGPESGSDFPDSDCSDCEILEGSHKEVREQWEKAFLKKMKKSGKAGLSEEACPSNLNCNTDFGSGFESRTEQYHQTSFFSPARNLDGGKGTSSTFFGTKKSSEAGLSEEAGPSDLHCKTNIGPGFESRTEQHDQASYFFPSRNPDGGKETASTFFGTDDPSSSTPLFGSQVEEDNQAKNCANSRFFCKENFLWSSSPSPGIQVEHERSDSPSAHFTSSKEPIYQNRFKEVGEQPDTVQVQCETSRSKEKNQQKTSPKKNETKKAVDQSYTMEVVEEEGASESSELDTVQVQSETSQLLKETQIKKVSKENKLKEKAPKVNQKKKAADQSYTKEGVEESSPLQTSDGGGDTTPMLGTQSNVARSEHGISSLGESREMSTDPIPSTSGQVQVLHGTTPAVDIMLNREKLKETDEYRKAQEEEWESRKRQLQLQAEEAQRQRKRRKLANTRQLEMERRQKERVEEVRQTQKKDEESMKMKEKVRAEIAKSLKNLEVKCINMASLLRGLGVPVGGGTSPLPHEVHAAYKRAALKFHPDRASRGDLKQQVEAEEKFKLIARMKDKFLS